MAAASTDKLRKWSRKWVGQIGAAGVSDASVATIPLASSTNLPTTTGITLVIDRVDSAGALTPTLEETIVGVVSGANIVTAVRGVEGTAQSHAAGAVVELLVTATEHNDLITHLLVEHNQDGTHASGVVVTLTGTQTLTNKTLTTPKIASMYQDAGATKLMTLPNTASDTLTANAATQTLTNKRVTWRVGTATDAATHTIDADSYDEYTITAQAQAFTVAAPIGTPTQGQRLVIRIKDNATARAITWNAIFRASSDLALPTTTVISKTLYCGFLYNSTDSKWDLLAYLNNF